MMTNRYFKSDRFVQFSFDFNTMDTNYIYRVAGNGNSNARVLKEVLKSNTNIHTVNVSDTGLDDYGLKELCEGLQANNSVTDLNLSFNHFGEKGADYLSAALTKNNSIKKLDLSRNALGFRSISSLLCVCVPKNMSVIKHGNYVFEEILNSVSHGIAFIGAVIGGNLLISEAVDVYKTDFHFWACVLYSFALMFLFLSSCLYHSFFMLPSS
jgi:ABC-type antimicrobial peptide transport system permease subunit